VFLEISGKDTLKDTCKNIGGGHEGRHNGSATDLTRGNYIANEQ